MNPEEEIPPEHEHRAYYRQPVWKRIVVVAAGPAVNIVLAFAILSVVFFTQAQQVEPAGGGDPRRQPGGEGAGAGRPHPRRRRQELPRASTGKSACKSSANRSARTNAPGKQVDGCVAATPVALRIERDGQARTILVKPEYDPAAERALVGFSYGTEPTEISVGAALGKAGDAIWMVTEKTASIFSHIFEEEQRKQISGIVGVSDAANQTIDRSWRRIRRCCCWPWSASRSA